GGAPAARGWLLSPRIAALCRDAATGMRFMGSFLSLLRMHWDHERWARLRRAVTSEGQKFRARRSLAPPGSWRGPACGRPENQERRRAVPPFSECALSDAPARNFHRFTRRAGRPAKALARWLNLFFTSSPSSANDC